MSGNGIFGIGSSALLAYQRALQVTGHNIANVGTEGYSRQRVELAALSPATAGAASPGSGVRPVAVNRVMDGFVESWLGMNASAAAYERTYAQFASHLDNILADPVTGLTPALNSFFAAMSDVASDPTSTAARQNLLAEAESLLDRFAQLDRRIGEQRALANGAATDTVEEINQLAGGIAALNRQIVEARGRGNLPADLLDRRDQLVRDLADRVSVNTMEESDGSLNVYVGRGQGLVVGTHASQLIARSAAGGDRLEVGIRNGSTFVPITDSLSGGRLGALLDLGPDLLDESANALGRVAIALTDQFNELHAAGMDLTGALGGVFFSRPEPRVSGNPSNTATGVPALTIADIGELGTSDYQLRFDGSAWNVRRVADGALVATAPEGGSVDFDGLTLNLASVTGAVAGDTFALQPTRVARDLAVAISDPRAVAAALPVRSSASADNAGQAHFVDLSVTGASDPALLTEVTIVFSGGEYLVNGDPVPLDPSGDTTISVNGWTAVLRGTPADGDTFTVRDNIGGVGDNRGALALAGLAGMRVLSGGTATLSDSYAELVVDVGVKTRRAQINADVQEKMLHDARAHRDSISGVNLDEEAANLLRYQQAYQAAAQVIAVAGSMFDTLIAAVRR